MQRGGVVFFVGDDPGSVKHHCAAEMHRRGVDPAKLPLRFVTGRGDMLRLGDLLSRVPDLALVVAADAEAADCAAALAAKPAVLALRRFAEKA